MKAVESRNVDMVKLLVSHGSDIHARNNQALIMAAYNLDVKMIEYLLSMGLNNTSCIEAAVSTVKKYGYCLLTDDSDKTGSPKMDDDHNQDKMIVSPIRSDIINLLKIAK